MGGWPFPVLVFLVTFNDAEFHLLLEPCYEKSTLGTCSNQVLCHVDDPRKSERPWIEGLPLEGLPDGSRHLF